ncbi:MAG: ABC transporter permease [Bacteroidetes bacterium]|nr:ABC transporter permease [Bacteroidota bacterium]
MNLELFIARRIFADRENKKKFSRSIISFALFGIAFGVMMMILSMAVVTGFKKEIRDKVIGFGSHIQIVNFDSNSSFETTPVSKNQSWLGHLNALEGIKHVEVFATKPGIIKTDEEMMGMVLKGVGPDFDWKFFRENLVSGSIFAVSDTGITDKILISKQIASQMKLKVGDPMYSYFLNDEATNQRMRKFSVAGIYQTSLEEFDRLFVLSDIQQVQKLNNWQPDQVSGFEIAINDFDRLSEMTKKVKELTIHYSEQDSTLLRPISITSKYPQIFDWLNLLDMNVWIILTLIILVAGFNMVSGLLILILERTSMIGTLKAVGSNNRSIRKIFLYLAFFLIGRGMLWGNIAGIGICLLQSYFGIFKLDPTSYYLEYVPVNLKLTHILLLNAGTLVITLLMLIVPSWYVSRISPDRAIRFD